MQVTQAVREIDALRQSQKQASAYRHDLRHHLQYLAGCIEEGQTERAQAYISGICAEIEAQKVQWYCENDTANLILSAFAQRASRDGISLNAAVTLPPFLLISDSDLCVLLSNALENALHACQNLPAAETPPVFRWGLEQDSGSFCRWPIPAPNQSGLKTAFPSPTARSRSGRSEHLRHREAVRRHLLILGEQRNISPAAVPLKVGARSIQYILRTIQAVRPLFL